MSAPSKQAISLPSFYELESSALKNPPSKYDYKFPGEQMTSFDNPIKSDYSFQSMASDNSSKVLGHAKSSNSESKLAIGSPVSDSTGKFSYDEKLSPLSHSHSKNNSVTENEFPWAGSGHSSLNWTQGDCSPQKRRKLSVPSTPIEAQITTFKGVQSSLEAFATMTDITNKILSDLQYRVNNQDSKNVQNQTGVTLSYPKNTSTDFVGLATMEEFLDFIPAPILDNIIESAKKYVEGLETWKKLRATATTRSVYYNTSNRPGHLRHSSVPAEHINQLQSSSSFTTSPPTLNKPTSPSKLKGAPMIVDVDKTDATHSKRRASTKQASTAFKTDVISLRVNPLKPYESKRHSLSVQPPSRKAQGQLHPELSAKQELVCMQCGRKNTPEWRKGPEGAKTLCNACGLFHSKLLKRAGPQEASQYLSRLREQGIRNNRRLPKSF